MGRALGIFLGKDGPRRVLLAGRKGTPRILEAGPAEAAPPGTPAALVLPPEAVKIRRLHLPLTRKDLVAKALRFQAERFLPNLSPGDLLLGRSILSSGPEGTDLLLCMARKDEVEGLLGKLGLSREETALVPAWWALFHLLGAVGRLPSEGAVLALFFLEDLVFLLPSKEGVPLHVRRIPAPGGRLSVDRIQEEVRRTAAAAGLEEPFGEILAVRPLPEGLDPAGLEAASGLPVSVVDPAAPFRREASEDPCLPALGAALARLGRRKALLELREREPEEAGFYEKARPGLLLGAFFLLLWLASSLMGAMTARAGAEEYQGELSRRARALYHRFVKSGKPRFSTKDFDKSLERLARRKEASGRASGRESFLDFLSLLTRNLPADPRRVILSVHFKEGRATLRGEAESVAVLESLARSLEASGAFRVRIPFRMRGGRKGGRRLPLAFTIELEPREGR